MTQNTSHAVMSQRSEPHDSLDFFPTPWWSTRALCEWIGQNGAATFSGSVWEPACGAGDMAKPLAEYFGSVHASDIFNYGFGEVDDFLIPNDRRAGWVISNPPFRLAQQFVLTALERSDEGVAMLVRTAFLEGGARHRELFSPFPPSEILQFVERVPMVKGRLDKSASTATSYCWICWRHGELKRESHFHWLAPCRKRLERPGDYPITPDEAGKFDEAGA
mgnify:CR=1 FL=1